MPVEFVLWDCRLPFHKKAYQYLKEACRRSNLAFITPEDTIESARQGLVLIYMITDFTDIIGCFTLSLRPTRNDLFLELPLLAGKRLKEWRQHLVDFLFETAKDNHCTRFSMIGRKGFERLFPELKLLCCVYGRNLTEGSENIQ